MGTAVDHVHHRHRQHVRVGAADVTEQRQFELVRRSPRHRERHAEDGVGPQAALVVGAVEIDHREVEGSLVEGLHADERSRDLGAGVSDGLGHALAPVAVSPVAQLDRLELSGRRPRRDDGAAPGARLEEHLDLDRGVAARVEHLTPKMCSIVDMSTRSQSYGFVLLLWRVGAMLLLLLSMVRPARGVVP